MLLLRKYIILKSSLFSYLTPFFWKNSRHGDGKEFSVRGLEICVNFFKEKSPESEIIVMVHRKRQSENMSDFPPTSLSTFNSLREKARIVNLPNKTHDDWAIIEHGYKKQATLVSNDQYRSESKNNGDDYINSIKYKNYIKDLYIEIILYSLNF
jgi:hypothetical protein